MKYRKTLLIAIVFAVITLLLLHGILRAADFRIERVSVSSSGEEGNAESNGLLSGDGRYVLFTSASTNLVANDTNGKLDAFVHDTLTGETTLVSITSLGGQSNGHSAGGAISRDGRYVAFTSNADNLVSDDTNGTTDVFVHDRLTGETSRVSISSSGEEGDWDSGQGISISQDGRYVLFASRAGNFAPGHTFLRPDIYIHDRVTGETTLQNVSSSGIRGNQQANNPTMSDDGRYVVFGSSATDLVANDLNWSGDIFVHDRLTGETIRASVSSQNVEGNQGGDYPSVSGNGRYITFISTSDNLVPGDNNSYVDVFVRDLQTGITSLVSVSSLGEQGNDGSDSASISDDGRFVAFESYASNLVPNDTNGTYDVFIHDMQTGETILISHSASGAQGNSDSVFGSISRDGRYIAFDSGASNLIPNDTNGYYDVFVVANVLAPDAPNRNYFTALPITLTWNRVSGVIGYQVQVATSSNFDVLSIAKELTTVGDVLHVDIPTLDNGFYYWRVRGQIDSNHWGAWSEVQSFTLAS